MKSGFWTFITATILTLVAFTCCNTSTANSNTSKSLSSEEGQTVEKNITDTKATILFAGDAMLHQLQGDVARKLGGAKGYNFNSVFELLKPEVSKADYAVVNLEVPLGGGLHSGYPRFSAPDAYAKALKDAGFDLFLLANNHMLDRGDAGARRTIETLTGLGVDNIGAFKNKDDRKNRVAFIKDINGIKVGFLNYTYSTNGINPTEGVVIPLIERDKMADEIKHLRKEGAELVCVCIHWGTEYVLNENKFQREMTDFLLGEGVDLVIGGHPHVIQPMAMVKNDATGKNAFVVYSLGNLVSNMTRPNTRGGAYVKVNISRDSNGEAQIDDAVYDLFITQTPVGNQNFRVIPRKNINQLHQSQRANWDDFYHTAKELMDTENKNVAIDN